MKKLLAIVAAGLLTIALAGAALAQSTDAAKPTPKEPSAYVTLDLQAGFALDPFLVSINGGGAVEAKTLDPKCTGYIHEQPQLLTKFEGAAKQVDVFFYSDNDATMVIQLPDGSYLCNDDDGRNVLDPEIKVSNPVSGTYKLWIGSPDANQLVPGLLVLTARDDVSLNTFDPGKLIKRPPLDATKLQPPVAPEAVAAEAILSQTEKIKVGGTLKTGSGPLTANATINGVLPAALLGSLDPSVVCSGLISKEPTYIVKVDDKLDNLDIFFEGSQDSSLVVLNRALGIRCNDDSVAGKNANPEITIENAPAGYYAIWVGRYGNKPVQGTLTVSTSAKAEPRVLPALPEPTPVVKAKP